MKKLTLQKESIRVLVANDLSQVHGGFKSYSSPRPNQGEVSSPRPNQGGTVSSPRPTPLVSSPRPGNNHRVSSVRPVLHKLSSALHVFKRH
jgi:hypothetical protein